MLRNIEIKKLNPNAVIPTYGTIDSAGVDLAACMEDNIEIGPLKATLVPTGLAINMQNVTEKCVAMIFPRSGKGHKEGIVLGNSVGIIDQDYHGELKVSVLNRNPERYILIMPGDKIAQLVFIPIIKAEFTEVSEFSSQTDRGTGGFGSTGG
jgi:dUTP pyrophosphatase